ncbi:hypothetical protein R5R35_011246 [Gryllus longicercus]|uniref:Odorant binding protein n=1 Tax=Gryllus longicercus TaxID=2509291 RepID=A0AAN9VSW8_9ORTH
MKPLIIVFLCLSAICLAKDKDKNLLKKCYKKFKNADPNDQNGRTHDSKCLLHCILEAKKQMSGNKIDHERVMKEVEEYPPWRSEEYYKRDLEKCKLLTPSPDPCQTAYEYQRCILAAYGIRKE